MTGLGPTGATKPGRGRGRLVAVGVALLLAWGGVGYRLVVVQGVQAATFSDHGEGQRVQRETLAADRGTIFDRDGRELAVTVDSVTVYANPLEIDDPATVARLLAPLIGEPPGEILTRLAADSTFVYVARQLERDQAQRVKEALLPGIYFLDEPKRAYPLGSLTAHVVGFVQPDDNRGLEGLELQYDTPLAGTPGELVVERDPQGRTIPHGDYSIVPAEPGSDLVLTIKTEIQFAATEALQRGIDRTGAVSGTVVVLQPETGEVLAMVTLPGYDPNDRSGIDSSLYRNRAVTDLFEPGSTQKLVTIAAALESGLVDPWTAFDIPEAIEIEDTRFEDFTVHPDQLTVTEIVAYSSNLGTILVGELLGARLMHEHMYGFGEGRATGVDFPGEAAGILSRPEDWCPSTCVAGTSIGYHVAVTPLQMAQVYATVANDGVWVQPHLVREIVDGHGAKTPVIARERQVVSAETAGRVRLMLEAVVDLGTGGSASVIGYRVGGKTGTTQQFDVKTGEYSEEKVVASFIGMAPINDPKVVVAVVLDSPLEDASGGSGAAPIFAEVMEAALHQLGVPPDGS